MSLGSVSQFSQSTTYEACQFFTGVCIMLKTYLNKYYFKTYKTLLSSLPITMNLAASSVQQELKKQLNLGYKSIPTKYPHGKFHFKCSFL
jgi:hypothetical protein